MRKRFLLGAAITVIFLGMTIFIGCGSDSSSSSSGADSAPVLGTLSSDTGNTSFAQNVAAEDGDGEYFPGHANVWDLDDDFSLDDGGDDQFDNAMELTVDGSYFSSQNYADLTFYTPAAEASDGVVVAVATDDAINGSYSGQLNDLYDGRLFQEVDLSAAASPITISWDWDVYTDDGDFDSGANYARLVVRDPADGSLLSTLSLTQSEVASGSADLTAYAGRSVIVSFEVSSNYDWERQRIDDVSILDNDGTEFVTNGDFETGDLTGWSTNSPSELQNMTSADETLSGLTVTRSFYTVPDSLWGRWVDVFENQTAAAITATVEYESELGSDDYGILYMTPDTGGKALTCWDGDTDDRDVGFVFGSVDSVDFTSDDGLGNGNGSDYIYHQYVITVDPGEKVAIVNFIIMNGADTGETAADITARATDIDTEAVTIVDNFWTDGQYRTGMTQEQIDAIANF